MHETHREISRNRYLFHMILLLKCIVLFFLHTNVSVSKKFLCPVPKIFFFNHLQVFDVVLAYLEFRGLFLKIKKGKGRKARSSVFL